MKGRFRRSGPLFPFVIAMGPKGRTRTPTSSPRHLLKVRRVGPQSGPLLNIRNRINGEAEGPYNPATIWSMAVTADRLFFPLRQLEGIDLRGAHPKVTFRFITHVARPKIRDRFQFNPKVLICPNALSMNRRVRQLQPVVK